MNFYKHPYFWNIPTLLTNLNQLWLSTHRMQKFFDAIHYKGSPFNNCMGFINITVRPICWPGQNQMYLYNGRKHTYQVLCIMHERHASALFLRLTGTIKITSCINCCVAFKVNIHNKIQRSTKIVAIPPLANIHFRFRLDINTNFTIQNVE